MIKEIIKQEKTIMLALFAYAFILIFFCSKMSPFYPINEWPDVNLYFNLGKMIVSGKTLYTEAFDHKGPLIFFIYGTGSIISESSLFGMYIIESLGWVFMIFFAYFTARLFLDKIYGFVTALLFSVYMLSYTQTGGSAEEFIAFTQVISLYFFIKYFKDKNASIHNEKYMLVHGLMSSITLFIKINLVIFWVFPLLAIFINLLIKKEYKSLVRNIGSYLIGVLIVALPIIIYFLANGALVEAWSVYITLNLKYAGEYNTSLLGTIEKIAGVFYLRLRYNTVDFLVILTGAIYFSYKFIKNRLGAITIALSFFSLFTVIFIAYTIVPYYVIPYYVYALPGCIVISSFLRLNPSKTTYILSFILILTLGIKQKEFFGFKISDSISSRKPSGLVLQFSEIIKSDKDATLLNLSLDEANAVFTLANIKPTLKYFTSPNLSYKIYPQMRDEQTKYIENKDVKYIFLSEESYNYEYFRQLEALKKNYEVLDLYLKPPYNLHYYLYKRKD